LAAAAPGDRLWAAEQTLSCAGVAAVLAWLPQVRAEQLRRLQMIAQTHRKPLFLMRPAQAKSESSPAMLRLLATDQPDGDALLLHIIKRRGPTLDQPLLLAARPARLAVLLKCSNAQVDPVPKSLLGRSCGRGFLQGDGDVLACAAGFA